LQFNPKAIQEAAQQATQVANLIKANPLIVAPYLSEEQLRLTSARQSAGLWTFRGARRVCRSPERLLTADRLKALLQQKCPAISPLVGRIPK
jgi:hypothetical protein